VLRHSAIVGSTGAGKTSAVASLLQSFIASGWNGANIIVIDPHCEYATALGDSASVLSVLGEDDARLRVPYWALPGAQILRILAGPGLSGTGAKRFGELVAEQRRVFAEAADWLSLDPSAITSDTPVPFDINKVWYDLDYANRETLADKANPDTTCEEEPGDPAILKPARFTPYAPAGGSPCQGRQFGAYANVPERLRLGLVDPRMKFFLELTGSTDGPDPLVPAMQEWLGGRQPVSVLNFNGVPAEAAEAAIGVILRLLFEVAVRSPDEGPGIGRPNPVLVILEEAHRYLGDESAELARNSANRIAREGRKYGIGLMLVTQRPSELPDTALAQCGTLISLRLSSQADQTKIRSALPDSVAGLAAVLPSLRTGEAIISGEAVVLPSRVLIRRPDPLPKAEDPSLAPWRAAKLPAELHQALAAWREAYAQ
jgi:DNA helicase HerA-like ATPase